MIIIQLAVNIWLDLDNCAMTWYLISVDLTFTKATLKVRCHPLSSFYSSATRLPFTWLFTCPIFIETVCQNSELATQGSGVKLWSTLQISYQLTFITKNTLQKTLGFLCSSSHIRNTTCQLGQNLKIDGLRFGLQVKGLLSAAFWEIPTYQWSSAGEGKGGVTIPSNILPFFWGLSKTASGYSKFYNLSKPYKPAVKQELLLLNSQQIKVWS